MSKKTKMLAVNTIQMAVAVGKTGDKNKGVSMTPPEMRSIPRGTTFMADADLRDELLAAHAAVDYVPSPAEIEQAKVDAADAPKLPPKK